MPPKEDKKKELNLPFLIFLLVAWYTLNVQYNLYNKKILNAFPYPYTVSLSQVRTEHPLDPKCNTLPEARPMHVSKKYNYRTKPLSSIEAEALTATNWTFSPVGKRWNLQDSDVELDCTAWQLASGIFYVLPVWTLGLGGRTFPTQFSVPKMGLLASFHGSGHFATVISLGEVLLHFLPCIPLESCVSGVHRLLEGCGLRLRNSAPHAGSTACLHGLQVQSRYLSHRMLAAPPAFVALSTALLSESPNCKPSDVCLFLNSGARDESFFAHS